MNKMRWIAGGAFGIGAVMLLVSGFSAMASNTSGYDAYKTALKNTKAATSITANLDLTVTDNGAKLFAGTSDMKWNRELNTGSLSATFGDSAQKHAVNVFRQEGKVIFKTSDNEVYRVTEHNDRNWGQHGAEPNPPKVVGQVFDALIGNIKELATVENAADGGKKAELHLSGGQIPVIANVLGTLAVSKLAESDQWDLSFPKLRDNIKVEAIHLDANINANNFLEQQSVEITIAGTDDSGNKHNLVLLLHVNFSDFNETVTESIDLTGKQTLEIQNDGSKRGWNH
ncbi:MAG: hypothetical protein K0Q73_4372 [Paenibacillus sp.]|jgi:hypothetical protein|nr:hypothetical protein [Paenibacillus sp.]